MTDTPKLRAYAVAMLFGVPPNAYLALWTGVSGTPDQASAFAVATMMQDGPVQGLPLTMVATQEMPEGLLRSAAGPATVVPLRAVQTPEEMVAAQPRAWSESILGGRLHLAPDEDEPA